MSLPKPTDPMIPDRRPKPKRKWRTRRSVEWGYAELTEPYDLTAIEAKLLLSPDSIERSVALLVVREAKRARLLLQMMRDVHANVQFDTPEDTAVQDKAVAMADDTLNRTRP